MAKPANHARTDQRKKAASHVKVDAATAMAAATTAVVTVQKAKAPKPVQHPTNADSHRKPCHPW